MYRLQFLNGKFKGTRLNIQQASLTIGRSPECHINLDDDDEVSRQHAVIEYRGGSPVIRDLGSINTVEVNNIRVKEHRLRHGDRIEVGRTAIEFLSNSKHATLERKHRFSKMQAVSFISIGMIVLLQVLFVLLFPLWQKRELVPIMMPEPEATVGEAETLSPELETVPEEITDTPADIVEEMSTDASTAEVEEPSETREGFGVPEEKLSESIAELLKEPLVPVAEDPVIDEISKEAVLIEDSPDAELDRYLSDPLAAQAREMLADAEAAIAENNVSKADNILERTQMIAPDFVPAWQARAALFEQRGMLAQADKQWEKVMELSAGSPLYNQASEERRRIARKTLNTTKPPERSTQPEEEPARYNASARKLEKRIRIHTIERERFQANEEFDEMRMVRITLRPRNGEGEIESDKVRIVVHFYDRLEGSSRVMLTRALVPNEAIRINDAWPAGESRRMSATYILKKGFREREQKEIGEKRTYEGYRVSVYYDGVLQDESAMPRKLLDLPMPPRPAVH